MEIQYYILGCQKEKNHLRSCLIESIALHRSHYIKLVRFHRLVVITSLIEKMTI